MLTAYLLCPVYCKLRSSNIERLIGEHYRVLPPLTHYRLLTTAPTAYYCLLLLTTAYYCLLLLTTAYHCLLLLTTAHHFLQRSNLVGKVGGPNPKIYYDGVAQVGHTPLQHHLHAPHYISPSNTTYTPTRSTLLLNRLQVIPMDRLSIPMDRLLDTCSMYM